MTASPIGEEAGGSAEGWGALGRRRHAPTLTPRRRAACLSRRERGRRIINARHHLHPRDPVDPAALLRSFLTILGIVIGVGAVVTMVTLGKATTAAVQQQISALGSNVLQVRPGQGLAGVAAVRRRRRSSPDADAIATQIAGVTAVAPQTTPAPPPSTKARTGPPRSTAPTLAFNTVQPWPLAAGAIGRRRSRRRAKAVCLIGNTVRKNLFRPAMRWARASGWAMSAAT